MKIAGAKTMNGPKRKLFASEMMNGNCSLKVQALKTAEALKGFEVSFEVLRAIGSRNQLKCNCQRAFEILI